MRGTWKFCQGRDYPDPLAGRRPSSGNRARRVGCRLRGMDIPPLFVEGTQLRFRLAALSRPLRVVYSPRIPAGARPGNVRGDSDVSRVHNSRRIRPGAANARGCMFGRFGRSDTTRGCIETAFAWRCGRDGPCRRGYRLRVRLERRTSVGRCNAAR